MQKRSLSTDGHMLGVLLVIASALMFSLSGVLTKAIAADVWTIVCWRGLIGGAAIAAYVAWRQRGRPLGPAFRLGPRGWVLAIVGSLSSLAFIYSFKLTYVANVAVIYATAPFMAAGLGWWIMRESVHARTFIAGGFSLLGVAIVVAGGLGTFSVGGDMMAVVMTFGNALYMVLIRRFCDVPVVWAGGMSALQLFFVSWLVTDPLAVSAQDAALLAAFGLSFAVANVLWTEGTRLIPAAQSGLFGSAETPFAIILAWLLLAELPPVASFAGGSMVLAAVFGHAAIDARRKHEFG
ncbi:DMT family transporter [Hoeflea sp. TYP-13]|uniref:DMT family transporter n=1 Tax=Hoeflea sp. TYP-13 TaxID=3230023 RepID=UPI0034C6A27C